MDTLYILYETVTAQKISYTQDIVFFYKKIYMYHLIGLVAPSRRGQTSLWKTDGVGAFIALSLLIGEPP